MLLKEAIEKAGSDDREKIIDNMGDLTITVGNGSETMRASDHHMILNMLIGKFTGGKLVVEKDLGSITPSDQCTGKSQ
jgi:ABC-type branched-subunit amino acid transport system substrate-binding protein